MCQLTETALKGYLAQKFKDDNECLDTTELDQDIKTGKKAADAVCQYVDWLLSTVNPNPPDENMWIRPETHPCQRRHQDVPDHHKQSDYVDLLNMVQRHTCCSTVWWPIVLIKKHRKNEIILIKKRNIIIKNKNKTILTKKNYCRVKTIEKNEMNIQSKMKTKFKTIQTTQFQNDFQIVLSDNNGPSILVLKSK